MAIQETVRQEIRAFSQEDPPVEWISAARGTSFKEQTQTALAYDRDYGVSRGLKDYQRELPTFQSEVNFLSAIQSAIAAYGKARVLDIGCGKGQFLRNLRRKFKQQVDLVGISARDWRTRGEEKEDGKKEISYLIFDAQKLGELGRGKFDCLVSLKALEHMADPLAVFEGAYQILGDGGYAFLEMREEYFQEHFEDQSQFGQCLNYLDKEYVFCKDEKGRGLAFRKTGTHLRLPIERVKKKEVIRYPGGGGKLILTYRFREGVVEEKFKC